MLISTYTYKRRRKNRSKTGSNVHPETAQGVAPTPYWNEPKYHFDAAKFFWFFPGIFSGGFYPFIFRKRNVKNIG